CLRNKGAAISATNLSGNSKKKGDCPTIARGCADFRGTKHMAAEVEKYRVIGNTKGRGHRRIWFENECLICGFQDDCFFARGLQRELARMKEAEHADADILGDSLGIKGQSEEEKEHGPGQHAVNPPDFGACGPR